MAVRITEAQLADIAARTGRDPKTGRFLPGLPSMTVTEIARERALRQPRDPSGRFLPSPPPIPTAQAERDTAFLEEHAEPPLLPEQAQPPPLPQADRDSAFLAQHAEPPPLPPQVEPELGELAGAAGGAMSGAMAGRAFGPVGMAAGAVGGAAASWLISQANKPRPIGTLAGGPVQQQGDDTLRQLLDVTKQMARLGMPVKDAVLTKALGSRM